MVDYYRIAKKASLDSKNHPAIKYLKNLALKSKNILDVGCGEGSRLNLVSNKSSFGIDLSSQAIQLAKKQYPKHKFRTGIGEKLSYVSNKFDLVYSAFAIEHCQNPEKFIQEMIRVCTPNGHIVIIAPNYGSPNRRSPVSTESPLPKLFTGLFKDFSDSGLNWQQVSPKIKYDQIDDDTTQEPYLNSLIKYLQRFPVQIKIASSLWELESPPDKFYKQLFFRLGKINLYPFKYWGPQLFICIKKL